MKVLRYCVVDLDTGDVLDEWDNLHDALEALDDRKTDYYDPKTWDGVSAPDIVVIDIRHDLMYDDDRSEIVKCWHDAFTGTWRRILEVAA